MSDTPSGSTRENDSPVAGSGDRGDESSAVESGAERLADGQPVVPGGAGDSVQLPPGDGHYHTGVNGEHIVCWAEHEPTTSIEPWEPSAPGGVGPSTPSSPGGDGPFAPSSPGGDGPSIPSASGGDRPSIPSASRGDGPFTPSAPGDAPGKREKAGLDGRTDSQIRGDLEKRTGKSYGQLVLGLGRGPLAISPRQLEKELEGTKTIQHREVEDKPPVVIDNVLVRDPYKENRFVSEGRVGPEAKIDAAIDAGRNAVNKSFVAGMIGGVAGMKPGSASEGLVAPEIRGYEPRPPMTYEPRIGAHKPASPATMRDLAGPRPGEMRDAKGFQNEIAVARLTGGTLARDTRPGAISEGGALKDIEIRYTLPNGQGGVARVDVIGRNGELIQVGGPMKTERMDKTISDLTHLRRAAEGKGVSAEAYFTSDTPNIVRDAASKVLGPDHVHTFERPEYKFR